MSTSFIHDRRQLGRPGFERRAAVRYSCFAQALGAYAADETTHFFEGRIIDLSLHGLGLRVWRKLETGVMVSLILEHGIFQCERSARVIHARRERDSWIVGCEFTVPLDPEELRRFQVHDRNGSNMPEMAVAPLV